MIRVLLVLGTRPEAIKLAPLLRELRAHPAVFRAHLCCTGQHTTLLDSVWRCFGVSPDSNLDVMRAGSSLSALSSRILEALPAVLDAFHPDVVVVQGDTTTTLCAAQAAFYTRVPVVHVEAGLRSGDLYAPFPEEMNRRLVAPLASLHCAPTESAAANLRREGIAADRIHVTGNTGIDALQWVLQGLDAGTLKPSRAFPPGDRRRVVVTMHRREAFGEGLAQVCSALNQLVAEHPVELVVPLHPNPQAGAQIAGMLTPHPHLHLTEALDYVSFVALMRGAHLLLTDSGGIQEEAPYLGVPLVVLRARTERLEGVDAGVASLAGFTPERILEACRAALFSGPPPLPPESRHGIYGDGMASARIRELIASFQTK